MMNTATGKKNRFTKEWKIGIISVSILLVFVWVAFFLAGRNLLTREKTYYAVYENTGGINVSGPVAINGKKVGRISEIDFVSPVDHRIRVGMAIRKEYAVNKGSVASIESFGLMSGMGIVIYLGEEEELLANGDYMEGRLAPDLMSSLNPIVEGVRDVLGSIDTIMSNLNRALDADAVRDINLTLGSLRASMQNIERLSADAEKLIGGNKQRIDGIVESLSASMENIEALSDTLAEAGIGTVIASLQTTLTSVQTVMEKVQAGEGSIGQLVYNDTLYRNIENSSHQLELLLQDLRENPKRYVHFSLFGKKDKNEKK